MKYIISERQYKLILEQPIDIDFGTDSNKPEILPNNILMTLLTIGTSFIPIIGPFISTGLMGTQFYQDYSKARTIEDKKIVATSYLVGIAIGAGLGIVLKSIGKLGSRGMKVLAEKIKNKKSLNPDEVAVITELKNNPKLVNEKVDLFLKNNSRGKSSAIVYKLVKPDKISKPFYHGTNFKINSVKELNPLFRETPEYQRLQSNTVTRKRYASSESGTGIYFSDTQTKLGPEDALGYMGKERSQYNSQGYMYEMELNHNAKVAIVRGSDYFKTTKESFNKFRTMGFDAVTDSENANSINLLNPKAVKSLKIVDKWQIPWDVEFKVYNPSLKKMEIKDKKRFWDYIEFTNYVKKHMGNDVNIPNGAGRIESANSNNFIKVQRPEL